MALTVAFSPDRLETAQYLEVSARMRPPNLQAHDMTGVDELAQRPVEDHVGREAQISHGFGPPKYEALADRCEPLQIGKKLLLPWTEPALAGDGSAGAPGYLRLFVGDRLAGCRPMY
ncbi:hypothetical protein AB4144_12570 [Rhizobiaceae sp. 2RAB30]